MNRNSQFVFVMLAAAVAAAFSAFAANGEEWPVARRLLLHALKRDYGFSDIIDNSPVLKSWRIEEGRFVCSFDGAFAWYCYNPDKSGPRGFEIAGEDGKFVAAELMNRLAKNGTVQGKELVVAAKDVPNPCRLRYLGGAHRAGSIYSLDSGLPPAPFEIGN